MNISGISEKASLILMKIVLGGILAFAGINNAQGCDALQVGPVKLGATADEVKIIIGKPVGIKKSEGFIYLIYEYSGLKIEFDEDDKVAGITSHDSNYCFNDWMCPGMSYASVKQSATKHGATIVNGDIVVHGDGCWVVARPDLGLVASVEMKCQP